LPDERLVCNLANFNVLHCELLRTREEVRGGGMVRVRTVTWRLPICAKLPSQTSYSAHYGFCVHSLEKFEISALSLFKVVDCSLTRAVVLRDMKENPTE
jgi:hypothetical protein